MGVNPRSVYLPDREAVVAKVRSALGEAVFSALWAAGRRLSPEEARAEAARVARADATTDEGSAARRPRNGLTPRELDVLRLLVEGRSDREIGEALFISHRTVMSHVTAILTKLDVENRTAATNLAVRRGLI